MLHQIGSGALGPVFRTYEPQRDRLVAVKAFRLDLLPEDVARLAESLRRLVGSRLKHPAVVAALDAGLEGTIAYLAMEYVAAETLDVALRHLAPAPIDRAWPLLAHIAEAIDAGWAAGQGHGALHPRDVFVTPGTQDVRVSGFGVLHCLDEVGVKAPLRRPYTAPERVAGDPFDITADIYSLGAIAHELLTGRRPAGPGEQDGALTTGTTPEQRVLIRKILSGALAERPRERFTTAAAFVTALRDVARGEPVGPLPSAAVEPVEPAKSEVAEPPPAPKRTPRFSASRTITPEWKDGKPVPAPVLAPETVHEVPVEAVPVAVQAAAPEVAPDADIVEPVAAEAPPIESATEAAAPSVWQPPPPQTVMRDDYSSYAVEPPARAPFPWAAIVAVGLAGIALGGVLGYRIGMSRAPAAPPPAAAATAPKPADTEVPIRAEPPPPPPQVIAPPAAAAPPPATRPDPASAAARQTPAAKPAAIGRLLVRSVPTGASIVIDGHAHGVTPATVRDLALGTHTIQISHAGYLTKTESVTLTATTPARNLIVELLKRQVNR